MFAGRWPLIPLRCSLLESEVVKQRHGISRKDLESLCDPGKYIGLCEEMDSSVVANKAFVSNERHQNPLEILIL